MIVLLSLLDIVWMLENPEKLNEFGKAYIEEFKSFMYATKEEDE